MDRRRTLRLLPPREAPDTVIASIPARAFPALWSIALGVLSALLVCLLIRTAFVGAFIALDLSRPVALLFIAAVVALTGCLLLFMREVFLAALTVHHGSRITPRA